MRLTSPKSWKTRRTSVLSVPGGRPTRAIVIIEASSSSVTVALSFFPFCSIWSEDDGSELGVFVLGYRRFGGKVGGMRRGRSARVRVRVRGGVDEGLA